MLPRHARTALLELATGHPVLALTGPRQSGKTTPSQATGHVAPLLVLPGRVLSQLQAAEVPVHTAFTRGTMLPLVNGAAPISLGSVLV